MITIERDPDYFEGLRIRYGEKVLAKVDEYGSVSIVEPDLGERNQSVRTRIEDGLTAIFELVAGVM